MKRWVALLTVVGTATIGGVAYLVARPEAGVTQAELVDAGITEDLRQGVARCYVILKPACRTRADGGLAPKYRMAKLPVYYGSTHADGGRNVLVVPPKMLRCIERLAGPRDEACTILSAPDAGCDDSAVCNAEDPTPETYECACRRASGNCRRFLPDGGPGANWPQGITIPAGQWSGAGCERKFCGPTTAGDDEWPEECPR